MTEADGSGTARVFRPGAGGFLTLLLLNLVLTVPVCALAIGAVEHRLPWAWLPVLVSAAAVLTVVWRVSRVRLELCDDVLAVHNVLFTRRFRLAPGVRVATAMIDFPRTHLPGLCVVADGRGCDVVAPAFLAKTVRPELARVLARAAGRTGCQVSDLASWTGDRTVRRRTIGGPTRRRR